MKHLQRVLPAQFSDRQTSMTKLCRLDQNLLSLIAAHLEPVSLAKLSCTCKHLRETASTSQLWERLSTDRWRFLNWHTLAASQSSTCAADDCNGQPRSSVKSDTSTPAFTRSFHKLYASNNSWSHERSSGNNLPPISRSRGYKQYLHIKWDFPGCMGSSLQLSRLVLQCPQVL